MRYHWCEQHDSPNHGGDISGVRRFIVIHGTYGGYAGSVSWLCSPHSGASAHFVVGKGGKVAQLIDTNLKSWANIAANGSSVTIEFETLHGEALTAAQLDAGARLIGDIHHETGIPIQVTDEPANGTGVAYHGLGAAHGINWGHPACPGPAILAQRPELVKRALARRGVAPKPQPAPAPKPAPVAPTPSIPPFPGTVALGSRGTAVLKVQQRLAARGWKVTADGDCGPATVAVIRAFQADKHLGVDGIAGRQVWAALWVLPVTR